VPVPDPEPNVQVDRLRAENRRLQEELGRLQSEFSKLKLVEAPEEPEPPSSHLLFVPTAARYLLVERDGAPPEPGERLEVPDVRGLFHVQKVSRAPVPDETRPCAFLLRG
jgi:hypothetical protein